MQATSRPNAPSVKESVETRIRSGDGIQGQAEHDNSIRMKRQTRYWENVFSSPIVADETVQQTLNNLEPSNKNPNKQGRAKHAKRARGLLVYTSNDEATATSVGGHYITYCYRNSPSASRTPNTFGAIGDKRPLSSSSLPNSNDSIAVPDNSLSLSGKGGVIKKSPISELFPETTPEEKPYSTISLNRRSEYRLADLPLITPSDLLPHPIHQQASSSLLSLSNLQTVIPHSIDNHNKKYEAKTSGASPKSKEVRPVWRRKGVPFSFTLRSTVGDAFGANRVYGKDDLDPNSFAMPASSIVIMVRSCSIEDLLSSVNDGVWSPSKTALGLLHWAWCARKEGEMVLILFTVNSSTKFCGLAEMLGEFDRHSYSERRLQVRPGAISLRWITVKDVSFARFAKVMNSHQIEYFFNGQREVDLLPENVRENVIKIFFEAPHARTRFLQRDNAAAFQFQDALLAPAQREYHNRPIVPLNHVPGSCQRSQLSAPARPGRVVGATNSINLAQVWGVPCGPKSKVSAVTSTDSININGIRYRKNIAPSRGARFSSFKHTSDMQSGTTANGALGDQYYSLLRHELPGPSHNGSTKSSHGGKSQRQVTSTL